MILRLLYSSSNDVADRSSLEKLLPSTESDHGLVSTSSHTSNKAVNHSVWSIKITEKRRLQQREVF